MKVNLFLLFLAIFYTVLYNILGIPQILCVACYSCNSVNIPINLNIYSEETFVLTVIFAKFIYMDISHRQWWTSYDRKLIWYFLKLFFMIHVHYFFYKVYIILISDFSALLIRVSSTYLCVIFHICVFDKNINISF